jgi:2-octaprenyl-6-methoxyphenol hydroxylase
VSKPNFYPLEISCLKKRVMGRIMFLGDGLNAIHPVAGQAFNMAVNDIKIIRDNIKTNLSLGLDFGIESYLKSGSFDILKNHLSLNFSTSFLVRLYSNNNPILKLSRTLGLGAFGSSKFLTNLALKVASGN